MLYERYQAREGNKIADEPMRHTSTNSNAVVSAIKDALQRYLLDGCPNELRSEVLGRPEHYAVSCFHLH